MKHLIESINDLHRAWATEEKMVEEDGELVFMEAEERDEPLEIQVSISDHIYINYDFYAPGYKAELGGVDPTKWEIFDYSNDKTYFMTDEELDNSKFGQAMRTKRMKILI